MTDKPKIAKPAMIERYSYVIVSLLLISIEIIRIRIGDWGGDFWEHAAAINELAKHPIHPSHPMLNIDLTHVFFSPYSLLLAMFSKVFGLSIIHTLEAFAYINLLLLLSGFYYFCRMIFVSHYRYIASIALIFSLFFWGSSPFLWSGFYHIFVLNYVLPYPSSFSLALSFFILALLAKRKPSYDLFTFFVILLSCIVFLSHPYTGVFLWISLTALIFSYYECSLKQSIRYLLILLLPFFFISILWPYYKFTDLFTGTNTDFHDISLQLYDRIIGLNWPVMLAIFGFFILESGKLRKFLFLTLLILILVYGLSYLFSLYGLSRVISNCMMISHIILAYSLVTLIQTKINWRQGIYFSLVLILFIVSLFRNHDYLNRLFAWNEEVDLTYYKRYEELSHVVSDNALILSDEMSNWYIPAYSGKVVASAHPLFKLKDHAKRKEDVTKFFLTETNDSLRKEIVMRYDPDYILIDNSMCHFSMATEKWLQSFTQTIYQKDGLILLKLKDTN